VTLSPRIEADSTKSIGIAAPTPSKLPPPSKSSAPPPSLPAGPGDLNAGRSQLPHRCPGPMRPLLRPRPTLGPPPQSPSSSSPSVGADAPPAPAGQDRRAARRIYAPASSGPLLPSCSLRELDARRAPSSRAAPSRSSTPSGPLLPSCSLRELDARRAASSRAHGDGREGADH
jgi:hypothetical protein